MRKTKESLVRAQSHGTLNPVSNSLYDCILRDIEGEPPVNEVYMSYISFPLQLTYKMGVVSEQANILDHLGAQQLNVSLLWGLLYF